MLAARRPSLFYFSVVIHAMMNSICRLHTLAPLALVALVVACSQSPKLGSPEEDPSAYSAFPGVEQAPDEDGQPLKVTMTRPDAQTDRSSVITVGFNQPMVEPTLGEVDADAPVFEMQPDVDGQFKWMGSRTAIFQPNESLPPATQFTVTVPADTESLAGARLGDDHRFEFHTPYLEVTAVRAYPDRDKLRPDSEIRVFFNMEVDEADLKGAMAITSGAQPVDVDVETREPTSSRHKSAFAIKPKEGFEFGEEYLLSINGALTPKGGGSTLREGIEHNLAQLPEARRASYAQHRSGGSYNHRFSSYGDLKVAGTSCGYGSCRRHSAWTVKFSNPVDASSVEDCISASGGVEFARTYTSTDLVRLYTRGVKAGETYQLTVDDTCKDIFGNTLESRHVTDIKVDHDPPRMRLDGGLKVLERATGSEATAVPLTLQGVNDVTVRQFEVPADQLAYVAANLSSVKTQHDAPFGTRLGPGVTDKLPHKLRSGQSRVHPIDLSKVLGKAKTGAVYVDASSPQLRTRYRSGIQRALIAVTDLGLTVKESGSERLIWVTRLSNGEPAADAGVALWDSQGNKVWSGVSDANGLIEAPGRAATEKNQPRTVTATLDEDVTIVDLNSWQGGVSPWRLGLSYSRQIASLITRNFVFTERGVYRAGETVHVKGYMRLERDGELVNMPADRAVVAVSDARGKNVAREEVDLSPLGGFSIDVPLKEDASLGRYSISVSAIEPDIDQPVKQGEGGSFRVEAYRTPEFEVLVEPRTEEMIVGREAKADIRGRYLFGAPMRKARVQWNARRSRDQFRPSNYSDYSFGANLGWWWYYSGSSSQRAASGSGELDDHGLLETTFKVPVDEDFQGPQKIKVEASITDVNRQQLSGSSTIRVHPGEYYVGVKSPGYLVDASEPIEPKAVAVDYDGEALVGKTVQMTVLRRKWKSVKKASSGGGHTWVSEPVEEEVSSCTFESAASPTDCAFDLDGPGSYLVKATSTDGLGNELTSSSSFYAYGEGGYWWGRRDDERIDLVADKDQYEVGDTARIMVPSPFEQAHALVTVERAGVLDQFTTKLEGTTGVVDIPVTEKMLPNAFVSVTLVRGRVPVTTEDKRRAGDSSEVDLGRPAFKIGYAELDVDYGDKRLDVSVTPESLEYRPGGLVRADLELRDASGEPTSGEVTFMAVDEGVLSLTGYKTPDPLDAFFASRPLGVHNRDTRLMLTTRAELNKDAEALGEKASAGGGGTGRAMNFRSKFASTAAFRARVDVGDDGKSTVEFELPENLTAYRLMAVAVGEGNRFGSAEQRVEINKPLMARPALPRFASTGDTFDAGVVVQAMGDFAGDVDVEIDIDGPLELTGERKRSITLSEGANQEVSFPVRTATPGTAKVRFVVRGEGGKGEDAVEVELPVRYPAAEESFVESGTLTMDSSWSQIDLRRRIQLPKGARRDVGGLLVELSSSAVGELLPGIEYLVGYPYGCLEQVAGRTLPLVSMRDTIGQLEMPGLADKDIGRFASAGVQRILQMQTRDGGLGYWPGASTSHPWASAYGGLILTRAKNSGDYDIDEERYGKLLDYLSATLRGEHQVEDHWRGRPLLVSQAFAAYVLAEAGVPEPSYHTRLFGLGSELPLFARALLAMAIHASGEDQAQMRDTLIDELLEHVVEQQGAARLESDADKDRWWMLWHSDTRADAIALMALLEIRPHDEHIPALAKGLLDRRRRGHWGNTQSTAFAIMALGEYFERAESITPDYRAVVGLGETEFGREVFDKPELRPRRIFIPMDKLAEHEGELLTIARRGPGGPLYYNAKLTYVPDNPPKTGFDAGMHLTREYIAVDGDNAGEPIEEVRAGQVVEVRLTLTLPEERHYLAIEDPVAAGFEPINTSFKTTSQELREASRGTRSSTPYWWWYGWARFDHTEQHDDKVLLFANHLPEGLYKHSYLVRATTPGNYTAPAARVSAMYEPQHYGRTDSATIEVR